MRAVVGTRGQERDNRDLDGDTLGRGRREVAGGRTPRHRHGRLGGEEHRLMGERLATTVGLRPLTSGGDGMGDKGVRLEDLKWLVSWAHCPSVPH